MEKTFCRNTYGNYATLDDAETACTLDIGCSGVYDEQCDGVDNFELCQKEFQFIALESKDSCIYRKTGKHRSLSTANCILLRNFVRD